MAQSGLQVLVIGGGLGGLCLAQSLNQAGISMSVFERDQTPAARDQGYRIHIDGRGEQALRDCLPPQLFDLYLATRGQPSRGATAYRIANGQLEEVSTHYFPERDSTGSIRVGSAVDRFTLRQVLLTGITDRITFGKEFTRYERTGNGTIRAFFGDGTSAVGDILVAADGVGSRVRQQFLPQAEVIDTGTRWLGGKTLLTSELTSILPARLSETFGFVNGVALGMLFGYVRFDQRGELAMPQAMPEMTIPNPAPYIFWGILTKADQVGVTDDELIEMPSRRLRDLALALASDGPPALRMLIDQCQSDQTFVLRMRTAKPIDHWQSTKVTLLGDAIHATLPRGSGANTALKDARLLSQSLVDAGRGTKPLVEAINDYEVEMLRYGFEAVRDALNYGTRPARLNALIPGVVERSE